MNPKREAGERVNAARVARGVTWVEIAAAIGRPPVWTVAAVLGIYPLDARCSIRVGELLELDDATVAELQLQPNRSTEVAGVEDPTIYRFHEALAVYGPALKELIHEEFGDGIMSAINFKLDVARRPDPDGDRVVVTFDGKFLPYHW